MTHAISTVAKILKVRFPNLTVTEAIELADTIVSAVQEKAYTIGDVDAITRLQRIVDASPFLATSHAVGKGPMKVVTSDHIDDWCAALARNVGERK